MIIIRLYKEIEKGITETKPFYQNRIKLSESQTERLLHKIKEIKQDKE